MYMYFVKSDRMCELIFSSSPVEVLSSRRGELEFLTKVFNLRKCPFPGKSNGC